MTFAFVLVMVHFEERKMRIVTIVYLISFLLYPFCGYGGYGPGGEQDASVEYDYRDERAEMVHVLQAYGIRDKNILAAMGKVRRHMYIPLSHRWGRNAYGDHPCSIGYGQTISQPYIVAYMTERMELKKGEKVLEIGTGSGYQAAILAEMGVEVYTIEIIKELAEHAQKVLTAEGYKNIRFLRGDGYQGWAEHAPYDAVIVTCAPDKVPQKLVEQLKEGGRMIVPVGTWSQRLIILRKKEGKVVKENDLAVRFVPMVHEKESP